MIYEIQELASISMTITLARSKPIRSIGYLFKVLESFSIEKQIEIDRVRFSVLQSTGW